LEILNNGNGLALYNQGAILPKCDLTKEPSIYDIAIILFNPLSVESFKRANIKESAQAHIFERLGELQSVT
jgi:hypothetical protein